MRAGAEELLRLGAGAGARLGALERIAAVDAACRRLDEQGDDEVLHDFRVAVRRLRTYLSAYGAYLPVGKKVEAGLRELAKATNAARDAEVAAAWLRDRRAGLTRRQRVAADGLLMDLDQECRHGYEAARGRLPTRWRALEAKLRKRLAGKAGTGHGGEPDYAQVSGALVAELGEALDRGLRRLEVRWDDKVAHRTRIKGKRLRYVLEEFGACVTGAEGAVASLKGLQDALGEINDSRVFVQRVAVSGEAAAARRARRLLELAAGGEVDPSVLRASRWLDPLPGLIALVELARERHRTLRGELAAGYFRDGRDALHKQVQGVADRLCHWQAGGSCH